MGRFRAGAPFRPWLLTIVANEARNRRRAAGRRTALAQRAAAEPVAPVPLPEAAAIAGSERRELAAALARARPRASRGDRAAVPARPVRVGVRGGARLPPGDREVAAVAGARAPAAGAGGRGCLSSSSSCARSPRTSPGRRRPTSRRPSPRTPAPARRARAWRSRRDAPPARRARGRGRGCSSPAAAVGGLRRARRRARVARPARRPDPPRARAAGRHAPGAGGRPRPPRDAGAGAPRRRLRRGAPGLRSASRTGCA